MGIVNEILFTVRLPYQVDEDKEVGGYVSSTPALDVFSQGKTREEAIANLKEAIGLFIESCYLRGTLDSVLRDCGFDPSQPAVQPQDDWLEVPLGKTWTPTNQR